MDFSSLPNDVLFRIASNVFDETKRSDECSSFPYVCKDFRRAWNSVGASNYWIQRDVIVNFKKHLDSCIQRKDIEELCNLFEFYLDVGIDYAIDAYEEYYEYMTHTLFSLKPRYCRVLHDKGLVNLDLLWTYVEQEYNNEFWSKEFKDASRQLKKLLNKADVYKKKCYA